jgi:PKD domain
MKALLLACIALVAGAAPAAALQILAPAPQTIVRSGSSITVTVGPSTGEILRGASAATGEEVAEGVAGVQPGTFDISIHVPQRAVGPTFVFAVADLAGSGVTTASVVLTADPGPLSDLAVTTTPVLTAIGQIARVSVKGVFADGVMRNLPLRAQGTTYRSTNSAIVAVDAAGRIQARTRGTAQIVVTNVQVVSGTATSAGVIVRCDLPNPPDNRIPIADAGADQTVAPVKLVRLNGSASADPDGDPITYLWTQESGRAVILRGADTASPFFLSPHVTAGDVLEFSLVVTDSKGASTLPAIVRVTVQP